MVDDVREIDGALTIQSVPNGCDATLRYRFGGYGAMFSIFPCYLT